MEERVGWRDVRFSETQKRTMGISVDSLKILKPMTLEMTNLTTRN